MASWRLIKVTDTNDNVAILRLVAGITDLNGKWESETAGRFRFGGGFYETPPDRDYLTCYGETENTPGVLWVIQLQEFWYNKWISYCNDDGHATIYPEGATALRAGSARWAQIAGSWY